MKKISLLLLILTIAISCSKNDELIDAPKSIKNTSWHKYFNKEEVKRAIGGLINTSTINSISLTYKIKSNIEFEMSSFVSTTQRGVNQTFTGTYTYNPNNGEVIFTYNNHNNINLFGKNSDKGVVNGNKMILENTFTFEQQ